MHLEVPLTLLLPWVLVLPALLGLLLVLWRR